jgi:carboxypeptidase Taq
MQTQDTARAGSRTPCYDALSTLYGRLHRLGHLGSIAGWDQAALMPPKGNEARAAALAELATLTHRMRTAPQLADDIERAEQEPLDEVQRANLREIRRDWTTPTRCPSRSSSASSWPARAASTPGARSARPTTGPASWRTSARCWRWRARRRRGSPSAVACRATTR